MVVGLCLWLGALDSRANQEEGWLPQVMENSANNTWLPTASFL